MSLGGQTLSRIQSLERLYRRGYRSKTVDTTIDKLLSLERDHARRELVRIEQHLHAFEAQYRLPSEEFYRRFQAGAFYQMWQSVEEQLATLGSEASG